MSPSLLNSIAGETMAFAKPVMGTIVPAPACFASFSYKCRQVSRAPRNTIVMAVAAAVSSVSSPRESHSCRTPSPTVQIAPPNQKRQQAVAPQRRIRAFAFEQLLIGLFIQFHARFPFLYA